MKILQRNSIAGLLVVLVTTCGCQKKQVFPGYTYVGTDGAETGFVDLESVQSATSHANEIVQDVNGEDGVMFSFVSQQSNGQYTIFEIFSDCSSHFRRMGGTSYGRDGSVLRGIPADSQPSLLSIDAVLTAAASAACGNTIIGPLEADGSFTIQGALQALYGNYDPQSHSALWNEIAVPDRPEFSNFRGVSHGTVGVAFDATYRELGIDKHIFVTLTKPLGNDYDCHVCEPLLGAVVFSKRADKWSIESEEKYLILGAGFGQRPRCQLVKVGPDKFGVMMHYGDMSQGFKTEWIVLISAEGNTVKPILTLTTLHDFPPPCSPDPTNPNDEDCIHYSVEYRFLPGSNPAYFDISTTKRVRSGPNANTSLTAAYSFAGGKYVSSSNTP